MTWRQLSMLIGQASMTAFGAHLVLSGQMTDPIGVAIVGGIVVLAVIGALGEAGARQIVAGLAAWRGRGGRGQDVEPELRIEMPTELGSAAPTPRERRTQDDDDRGERLDWRDFPGGPQR